ncbi:hypothetical protein EGI22_15680, partial [Lacihabitans sp. LS3-19]|nr:hypothetical protein [Lacihabitans sp. LS3-19]
PIVFVFELTEVPHDVVQVAVYVPAPTSFDVPTPPPDQVIVPPVQPVAVNVAFSVPQTSVLLDAITGAVGTAPVLIVIVFDTGDVPHEVVHVAVYVPAPTSFEVPVPNVPDQVIVPSEQPVAVKVALSVPQISVLLAAITGAIGAGLLPIVFVFELTEVPHDVVQVAVYVPAPTSFDVPTPPPDQVIVPPVQPVAVNVAFSVPQTSVLLDAITGAVGTAPVLIVIVFDTGDVPHEVVHVAVYVPAPTSFEVPVPNVPDQVIVPSEQPVAVKVALSVPQISVLLAAITGAIGAGLLPIVFVFELTEVPHDVVQVAVYVPAPTSFDVPTPPPDQVIVPPVQPVAVNVAFSVPQTSVLLDAITGAVGTAPVLIVIVFDTGDVPHEVVHVAVYVPAPTSFEVPVPNVPDQVIVPSEQPVAVKVALSVPQISVLLAAITGAIGAGLLPIVFVFELTEVPHDVVQVAVYVPAPTSFDVPTPPPDQVIVPPVQPVAVNVAFSVPQTSVLLDAITGAVGTAPVLIVIVFDTGDVPHEVVHVAVYVPAPTSFEVPVPNVPDQVIVPSEQPVAVKVALSVPQISVLLAAITGAIGAGLLPIVFVFELTEVPHDVVQVAVYVPAPTSFDVPTPPPDHVIVPPVQPVAVNVAFSVPQTSVLFDAITGAAGAAPVFIVIVFDTGEVPH